MKNELFLFYPPIRCTLMIMEMLTKAARIESQHDYDMGPCKVNTNVNIFTNNSW